jgi:outer membrane protein assembly factor BamB
MSSPGPRRWLRIAVPVAVLVVAGVAAAIVLVLRSPHNVSNPSVPFTAPSSSTPTTASTPAPPKRAPVDTFLWARYGYDAARTRNFAPPHAPSPPFRVGWRYQDYALLEFPPVIYGHTLYLDDDDASAKAIDAVHGHTLWEHKLGTLAAASPAIGLGQGLLYVPILSLHGHSPGDGALFALSMRDGHTVWERQVPAGTESSPLAYGDSVYFGDQSGTVYSLNARTGQVNWTYHASGAVKGGPAISNGILYFGDYAGRAYALRASDGHQVWAVSTSGTQFGFGSGNFYSTPAVAYGRVYMGNTDGRVYSFAARTGQLAWATGTGAYVYASPAVADVPGVGPTVFLGSYDEHFYAFDARTGQVRWSHRAQGRISGSATIVGHVVYYSDLGARTTAGLDIRTGQQVFAFPDGAFNPVVADQSTIYLSGYSMLYQMLPTR